MYIRRMKTLALASLLAFAPLTSWAATLIYNGGTASGTATITTAPVAPVGGFRSYGAYGFNMTDTTPGGLGSFVAWCLDITHWLSSGPTTYTVTNTPFGTSYGLSAAEMGRVQSVFDANYLTLNKSNNVQAAGFQVALWNAIYDTDWSSTGGGLFSVAAGAVANKANAFLANAQGFSGPRVYSLTFLESAASQNLVTAKPIPVPAAGFLLIGAMGAFVIAGRRKRATA